MEQTADNSFKNDSLSARAKHDLFRFICWMRQLQAPAELVREARLLGGGALTTLLQQRVAAEAFGDEVFAKAPPERGYQRRVLQALVRAAEEDGCELADELVELFTQAQLDGGAQANPTWSHKTFTYAAASASDAAEQREPGTISLWCSRNLLEGGTGCHEWSAGLRMTEFCLSNPGLFQGRTCLELGCGTGVTGVALARVGASPVLLTDGAASAADNCRANLELNGVPVLPEPSRADAPNVGQPDGTCVQVAQRAWEGDWSDVSAPDVLLGADILYDPAPFPELVSLAKRLLTRPRPPGRPPPVGFFSAQIRNEASLKRFEEEVALQGGLRLATLPCDDPPVAIQHPLRTEALHHVRMYRIEAC